MSEKAEGKISYKRITVLFGIFSIAGILSYFFGDEFRLAEKPAEYVGLIFSILAASLFAVVSIVGDPGMIMPGSSRHAWVSAQNIQRELQNFNFLFIWYLITLGLLVISELIEHACYTKMYWVTNLFMFFSVVGFLASLFLPSEFARIQRRRLQQEINSRSSQPKG